MEQNDSFYSTMAILSYLSYLKGLFTLKRLDTRLGDALGPRSKSSALAPPLPPLGLADARGLLDRGPSLGVLPEGDFLASCRGARAGELAGLFLPSLPASRGLCVMAAALPSASPWLPLGARGLPALSSASLLAASLSRLTR